MKKFFVAVALVMGLGTTVAFAGNLTSGVETVMAVNDFTPIEVFNGCCFTIIIKQFLCQMNIWSDYQLVNVLLIICEMEKILI